MIDLRSDTVTRPDAVMRDAMAAAEVGDDVYGDDPTVNALESLAAKTLHHEAAVFVPSGTQSNLIALLTHCQRGDEYIVGGDAHTYKYEGGGAAVLGGIQPQTLPFAADATLPLAAVEALIKPDDSHFARTRLLALENTQHGRVVPMEYLRDARSFCQRHNLILHLDGARVCNAAVALGVEVGAIAELFDSVSICLSKGLGAPVGSVLCGSAEFIHEARRWRKVTGGGMRQAGILAAAGIVSLQQRIDTLAEDHRHAAELAQQLDSIRGVSVREGWTQTNMVWLDFDDSCGDELTAQAKTQGILLSASGKGCRLVTHHDIDSADVPRVASLIREFFTQRELSAASSAAASAT